MHHASQDAVPEPLCIPTHHGSDSNRGRAAVFMLPLAASQTIERAPGMLGKAPLTHSSSEMGRRSRTVASGCRSAARISVALESVVSAVTADVWLMARLMGWARRMPTATQMSISHGPPSVGLAPRFTTCGPGQTPPRPQPMPKRSEPNISEASILAADSTTFRPQQTLLPKRRL